MADLRAPIVFDTGHGISKIGFAGAEEPQFQELSTLGAVKYTFLTVGLGGKEYFIGNDAHAKRGILNLKFPVECDGKYNIDHLERYLIESMKENYLRVTDLELHPKLFIDNPFSTKETRENITQMMFEYFLTPNFYMASSELFSLYHSNLHSGLVVDIGEGTTKVIPVIQGETLHKNIKTFGVSGRDLTSYVSKIHAESGDPFLSESANETFLCKKIKEQLGYVSLDYEMDMELCKNDPNSFKKTFNCNDDDNNVLTFHNDCFRWPELLFSPSFMGLDGPNLPDTILNAISACDSEHRDSLFSNIVLAGGSSMFPGLKERLQKELSLHSTKINIIAPEDRHFSAWKGGSKYAELPNFTNYCISKAEYEEVGPSIIHRLSEVGLASSRVKSAKK